MSLVLREGKYEAVPSCLAGSVLVPEIAELGAVLQLRNGGRSPNKVDFMVREREWGPGDPGPLGGFWL